MEKVLLVVLDKRTAKRFEVKESASEMEKLIQSSGGKVVGTLKALLERPSPAYYIREGKLQELVALTQELKPAILVFSQELTPTQMRNLEKKLKKRIVDRTGLILDIFAYHAKTREGKLQIELAQLIYSLPRLSDIWEEFSKLGGGIGTRGPGEQKLEVDRRKIRKKLARLKRILRKSERIVLVFETNENGTIVFVVSMVGYTNAGKSTLLNQLTNADVLAEDKLFATLDPTTRRLYMEGMGAVLLTDTVGFLKQLPHTLIEAFKATLEEINASDLILEVVDVSDPFWETKRKEVRKVLKEIGAEKIPRLVVMNKADQITVKAARDRLLRKETKAVMISAKTGEGVESLLEEIKSRLV